MAISDLEWTIVRPAGLQTNRQVQRHLCLWWASGNSELLSDGKMLPGSSLMFFKKHNSSWKPPQYQQHCDLLRSHHEFATLEFALSYLPGILVVQKLAQQCKTGQMSIRTA